MNTNITTAVIPARLSSTRLPGKLLLQLNGKSLLERVFDNINQFGLFDHIFVATDSPEIANECNKFKCPVIMTRKDHDSGTSRIAETVRYLKGDIIVNIQGDEPFIKKNQLQTLIDKLRTNKDSLIGTLVFKSFDCEVSKNPNIVKAVSDINSHALYFSRYPVPYIRDDKDKSLYWLHHLGVYAFKREFLEKYSCLEDSYLEKSEKLEQLKFLANGYKILLVEVSEKTIGIDTKEDFENALNIIKTNENQ